MRHPDWDWRPRRAWRDRLPWWLQVAGVIGLLAFAGAALVEVMR